VAYSFGEQGIFLVSEEDLKAMDCLFEIYFI